MLHIYKYIFYFKEKEMKEQNINQQILMEHDVSLPWKHVKWEKSMWPYVKTLLQNKIHHVQFFSFKSFLLTTPIQFNKNLCGWILPFKKYFLK